VRSRRQRALAAGTLSVCIAGATASVGHAQQLAFPEAEGFGRFATGARGNLASATIYHVTNLNDSGAGSFRDAVSQPNRFVVFDVGGIATISSVVTFAPNLTIAGQTAPGGFQVYGNRAAFHGADNLISRYWGVRNIAANGRVDAASIVRGHDMMFDHMSITWGVDGTFDINPDTGQVIDNLTIQNSLVSQGLDSVGHSTGGLMTLGEGHHFSIIKSVFADNVTRNPKVRGENEFINNVVYGYETAGYIMGDTTATSHANAEGNYFIEGPVDGSSPFASGTSTFHIYGNDNWVDSNRNGVLDGSPNTTYPGADVLAAPNAGFPTTALMTAQQAVQFVMANVGPSITRDSVDARIVQEIASYGTLGGVIGHEYDLFPNYNTDAKYLSPRARLVDTDNDGMPDNWETSRGLNPNNSSDFKNLSGGGYTRLEEYVNELGGYNATKSATAGGAWTNAATWGGAVPTFADTAVATSGITHASGNAFARQLMADGTSTVSGGTLDVFDTALIGANGTGSLAITGGAVSAGQIVLGATGRTGSLTLSGGTLQTGTIASRGGTASLTLNGGTIRFTGVPNITVPTTVGAAGATLNTNGFSGSITGGLSGAGTIAKSGAGTLTLGGNNAAYSGAINLNTGAITLATNAASSSTGTITAANGTQINVTASGAATPLGLANGATVTLSAGGLTYNGASTGALGSTLLVSNSSTGTSNFSIGGNLTNFAGTLDLGTSTGNIRIGSSGSALANFDAGDSTGTIRTSFDGTTNFGSLSGGSATRLQGSTNGSVASTYVIGANGNSTTFAGTIADGTNATPAVLNITKVGTGILTLTNTASQYTGVTTVNGGMLSVPALFNGGAASPIGDSSSAAANLVLDGGGVLRYTGGAGVTDRAFTVGVNGGAIDSSGSGAIDFNGAGSVVASGAGNRTLTLRGNNTGANFLRLNLSDPAGGGKLALTKDGSGTWRLAGNSNSYSGGTAVNAGKLIATSGSAFGTGALSVATGAIAQAQAGLSTALVQATVATAGTGQLDLTDNAAVIRSMTVSQVQALLATGAAGGAWNGPGINSSAAAGDATHLKAIGVASNGVLNKTTFKGVSPLAATDVLLKYTYYGDADLSGAATLDDFTLFLIGYQNSGNTWVLGDFDYSGLTTLDDFTLFLKGYQQQGAPLSEVEALVDSVPMSAAERAAMLAAVQAIPEPTGTAALAAALAADTFRRRRRHRRGAQ
jgi:autotransporter-associated beta strand protein